MTSKSTSKSNRHIVDQLHDVRLKIKVSRKLEESLKKQVSEEMGSKDSLGGDEHIAFQKLSERKGSIDPALAKIDGVDLENYRKPSSTSVSITTEQRVPEDM